MRTALPAAAFRWIFVAVILVSTLQTLIASLKEPPVVALATVETVGVLAFATGRWRREGATALVLVFAVALVLSGVAGEFAPRFFLFAATAVYLAGLDEARPVHRSFD